MSTFLELKTRISAEMTRADLLEASQLLTVLESHIRSAIRHYASRRTWDNEGTGTAVTVSGTQTVTPPAGLRRIDQMLVTVGGVDHEVYPLKRETMAKWHGATTVTGHPLEYSWEGALVRFYPTPDAAYTVKFMGIYDDDALSAAGDTNFWTGEGEDLIVHRTKYTLCRDIFYDAEGKDNAKEAMDEAFRELMAKASERVTSGPVEAGW